MELSDNYEQMLQRTTATVEKYREGAEELRVKLREARAGRKVQIMAMIDRLERKYDGAKTRLEELSDSEEDGNSKALGVLHQKVVSELSDMKRTIQTRIR
ncbi:hypothetical protein [Candidatus Palauibacter sp.]|uniref:hypothetical protein n=1 Tax=Candidatus Palauibacter sp. TaxID=3101350 RepID=UPI003B020C83